MPKFDGPRPPMPKLWPMPPMRFFDPSQNFMDPSHPRENVDPRHPRHFYPCQNFTDSLHPCHPCQSLTHDTHKPTHPCYPYQPSYLADSFVKTHGDFQICISVAILKHNATNQIRSWCKLKWVQYVEFFVINQYVCRTLRW